MVARARVLSTPSAIFASAAPTTGGWAVFFDFDDVNDDAAVATGREGESPDATRTSVFPTAAGPIAAGRGEEDPTEDVVAWAEAGTSLPRDADHGGDGVGDAAAECAFLTLAATFAVRPRRANEFGVEGGDAAAGRPLRRRRASNSHGWSIGAAGPTAETMGPKTPHAAGPADGQAVPFTREERTAKRRII